MTIVLLNIPYVQKSMSSFLSNELSNQLGTQVKIERIQLGMLNKFIVNDIHLNDLNGKELFKASRLSAKFEIAPLLKKRIVINSVQLFGFNIGIYQESSNTVSNLQFIIDALSNPQSNEESVLNLRINSILLRRGNVSYNLLWKEETPGKFNPAHIALNDLRANLSLKVLQNDSVYATVRQLGCTEVQSGFNLERLNFQIAGNGQHAEIRDLHIALPQTLMQIDSACFVYDSLKAITERPQDVRFSAHLQPSAIALNDISAFLPIFKSFKEKIDVEVGFDGTLNNLNMPVLHINGEHLRIHGYGAVQNLYTDEVEPTIYGNLSEAFADSTGLSFITRNLSSSRNEPPAMLANLGKVNFNGEISGPLSKLDIYGLLNTDLGQLHADVKLGKNANGLSTCEGVLETPKFGIGKMLNDKKIGDITFSLHVNGQSIPKSKPQVKLLGVIDSLEYSNYTYHNIQINGEYKQGGFFGAIALNDKNAAISIDGLLNTAVKPAEFSFRGKVDHFKPNELNLSKKYAENDIRFDINADFTGASIDDMIGQISIDNLMLHTPEKDYSLDQLLVSARPMSEGAKRLSIASNFMTANIEGDYSYHTLPASMIGIISSYLPSLFKPSNLQPDNNFSFDLTVHNTDLIAALLQVPIKVYATSTVKGFFNDKAKRMRIEGYFPRLKYDNRFIESAAVLAENPNNRFHASARFSNHTSSGALNVAAEAFAMNDSLQTSVHWGNTSSETFSGKLGALVQLLKPDANDQAITEELAPLKAVINLEPTEVIISDTLWNIKQSQVIVQGKQVSFKDFMFSNEGHHLKIDGVMSEKDTDSLFIEMNSLNIRYIFDIADLGVTFDGEATGKSYATGILGAPFLNSDLFIRNFGAEGGVVGDAQIHGEWHNERKGLWLEAQIEEDNIAHTHVDGYIYPLKPTSSLDLQIKADKTNISFLQYFLSNITPDFKGRVSGDVHLYGKFKALTLNGDVSGQASLYLDILKTHFTLQDSVRVRPEGLYFNNSKIVDAVGRSGRMNGRILYDHFSNIRYDLGFNVNNMLVMNTRQSVDYPFYGTIYGTGNVFLRGNDEGMNIDMAITTNSNSEFAYIKDGVTSAGANEFVRFVDKTPRRAVLDSISLSDFGQVQETIVEKSATPPMDIRMNILAEVTPDATIKIVMDPTAGDNISCRGSGNIRAEYYNNGAFNMYGSYRMNQGVYKLSMQEIIRKDLNIQDGSTLTFNGNPLEANLDLHAKYQVNSASLNDLIPNAKSYLGQTTVRVNCLLDITGTMTAPDLKLDLELPLESDEVQALVRNYIPSEEQLNMQILYLLSIGKFYTPDYVNVSQNSNMMSSVVSSTLSGQLNNALSNVLNSKNWNFGTNLSTGQNGWTDMEFEGILSGQLLNNRLLINGNFGYRDNQLSNTNFIGDFDAQLLLNQSGSIRLKAYNETNDRYFTRTNLTTQGFGIIFKKDINSWKDLFRWLTKANADETQSNEQDKNDKQHTDSTMNAMPPATNNAETLQGKQEEKQPQTEDNSSFVIFIDTKRDK